MRDATKIMGPIEWGLLLLLSVLWGGTYFFAKIALTELPPLTLVFGRVSLAAVTLNVVVVSTGKRMPTSIKMWSTFFVMGILNNMVPFSLLFWGQTQIASGHAAILISTTPLSTVVLAHMMTSDEKMTMNRLVGVCLGIAGVAWMIGPDALSGIGVGLLAQLAVLGAALSYSFAGIYGRRFQSVPPLVTASGQVTATTVMMVPVMLLLTALGL